MTYEDLAGNLQAACLSHDLGGWYRQPLSRQPNSILGVCL